MMIVFLHGCYNFKTVTESPLISLTDSLGQALVLSEKLRSDLFKLHVRFRDLNKYRKW